MRIVKAAEVFELTYFWQDHFDYETSVASEATAL